MLSRRFASNDSSLTPPDPPKAVTTEKPSEVAAPKRAFTLIDPKTIHLIKRVDDVPLKNEMDYVRHRLTENRTSDEDQQNATSCRIS